ncbi:MAG: SAM-dependent methyltransferase [Candidatus Rokuibacteriota bacterium]
MPVYRVLTALLAVVLLGCAAGVGAQAPGTTSKPLDVPYVPTKEPIVDQMLKMASVRAGDVIYDLGCGDGRIVITAAKRFGIRGVGIDIDPERIAEANANAKQAGVADRVKFIQGDLFDAKIGDATVVTLYLLPDVNLKLRPKLLSELRPGTRIVSHNYDMGDWKPQQTATLTVDGTEHTVYFWTVPRRAARARLDLLAGRSS